MADSKLSQLTVLTGTSLAAGDLFYVDDVSAGTSGSKSIRSDGLLDGLMRTSTGPLVYDGAGGTTLSGSIDLTGHITIGTNEDLRASGYQTFAITNPTIRWPSNSPDVVLDRSVALVLRLSDGSSGGATMCSPAKSPAQITANTDNYSPGAAWFTRLSSDAARNLTGMVAGVDGETRHLWNVGSFNITLKNQSGSSTDANRFLTATGADLVLAAGNCALAMYDGTTRRWRTTLLP